jgi:hypothetical protein
MRDLPLESAHQEKTCKYAESLGWMVHRNRTPGDPDRYFTRCKGQILFIEFKKEDEDISALQNLRIRRLRNQGFEVHVVDNEWEGYAIFDAR